MKVAWVELFRYDLPLAKPIPVRGRKLAQRSGLILLLANGHGHFGYGEIAPLPGFSFETLRQAIRQAIAMANRLKGQPLPVDPIDIAGGVAEWLHLYPSVRAGISMALASLEAARSGRKLAQFLAETSSATVTLNALLNGSRETVLRDAQALQASGYRTFKLKVGREDPAVEAETVQCLHEALGPDAALRLDANRAWDLETACAFCRQIERVPIEYFEEPLYDAADLPRFAAESGRDYALDESIAEDLSEMFEYNANRLDAEFLEAHGWTRKRVMLLQQLLGYAKAIVVKPTMVGEFGRLPEMTRQLAGFRGYFVVSSSFESPIGLAQLVHLAAALAGSEIAAGLGTFDWFHRDMVPETGTAPAVIELTALDTWLAAYSTEGLKEVHRA
ncbi:MAG: o-succinylbenzoate synthase [Candidatus Hydrogenedentes bacterium]|nr:o-succinylbenzoate synthase [Candidatus Hydrogenedentota bacterium]